ncbi:AraC family transcriptional regulator [Siphonobacter sp. SORGH_AS_0500]|uniref:helix-turn-helix domain-containing protein n=1 Tax=Siphonobacter sp. SORGH_AS_0500 TaxID=1864824 RepID=UPI000CC266B2|nr:helix-turn-helix transcriptional regulator [Siphonobacter sp. SORGH_AS_0500]PKK37457.1 AraC family transcriptional regulator [Siphonobacter sp. SORGH_AS_0500]
MSNIHHIETITEMYKMLPKAEVQHPLVAVVDFSSYQEQINSGMKMTLGFYSIMFKNFCINKMKYGQQMYDFQEGSLICMAPRQLITLDEPSEPIINATGWGLFFHPDLIRGTTLGKAIKEYSFFSYETSEALHLSEKEKNVLTGIIQKIDTELQENIDKHSQTLIVSNIELLLNYCTRYYERQFITRKHVNKDLLTKVEAVLLNYMQSPELSEKGLPTVKYLADQVNLSPNYLSDLLKKETGMNAQDRIHYYLIEEAKDLLLNSDLSISELAYKLGFAYPQYFSRLFKAKTGILPLDYRHKNF